MMVKLDAAVKSPIKPSRSLKVIWLTAHKREINVSPGQTEIFTPPEQD